MVVLPHLLAELRGRSAPPTPAPTNAGAEAPLREGPAAGPRIAVTARRRPAAAHGHRSHPSAGHRPGPCPRGRRHAGPLRRAREQPDQEHDAPPPTRTIQSMPPPPPPGAPSLPRGRRLRRAAVLDGARRPVEEDGGDATRPVGVLEARDAGGLDGLERALGDARARAEVHAGVAVHRVQADHHEVRLGHEAVHVAAEIALRRIAARRDQSVRRSCTRPPDGGGSRAGREVKTPSSSLTCSVPALAGSAKTREIARAISATKRRVTARRRRPVSWSAPARTGLPGGGVRWSSGFHGRERISRIFRGCTGAPDGPDRPPEAASARLEGGGRRGSLSFDTKDGTRGARRPGGRIMRWIDNWMMSSIRRTGKAPLMGFDALVLTTIGRKSGAERSTPLGFFPGKDGTWLIVASAAGAPKNPCGTTTSPPPDRAQIEMAGRKVRRGRRAAPARSAKSVATNHHGVATVREYQEATDRELPVILLRPGIRLEASNGRST